MVSLKTGCVTRRHLATTLLVNGRSTLVVMVVLMIPDNPAFDIPSKLYKDKFTSFLILKFLFYKHSIDLSIRVAMTNTMMSIKSCISLY